jgi:flagellar motility protein MotE (MotC chaperone)
MDEMMKNLEILDYKPGPNELTTKDGSMIVQDSIDAATWMAQEKEHLAKWKSQIEARQMELDKLDREVSQKLLKIEEVESARVGQLAKLYDGMQAPAVAQLLANLDDKTVVEILPRMNAKNASAVLALMPPPRAAKLSKQMMTIAEN